MNNVGGGGQDKIAISLSASSFNNRGYDNTSMGYKVLYKTQQGIIIR